MTASLDDPVEVSPAGAAETSTGVSSSGRAAQRRSAAAGWRGRLRRPQLWSAGHRDDAPRSRRAMSPGWAYARSVLSAIVLLALGFVVLLTVGSGFQGARDQRVLYNEFREQLANAIAPVGPLTFEGEVLEAGSPVAVLAIPDIDAELVVVEGTASAQTMSGPGHRRDTVLPGQAGVSIVMGRQSAYSGPFGRISALVPGSMITTTTGQGVATYRVDRVRRAGDLQPAPLVSSGGRLTLVSATGTPFLAEEVIRVDATLVATSEDGSTTTTKPFTATSRLVSPAALPLAERPMSGDSSQVFALVLWSQAFLLVVLVFTWCRERWGRWQAWTVGLPVLLATGWAVSNQIAALLPNLL